jgi:hypothetical protein
MNYQQRRTLGAFEKTFWLLDLIDSKDFALAAEIEGNAPIEDWRRALNEAQTRHPNLSVRIAMDDYARPILETVPNAVIPLRIVDANEDYCWETEVENELAVRFDTERAPLVRVILVEKPKNTVLIVVAHHAIADGTAVSYLIRDILKSVTGGELIRMYPQLSNDESLGFPDELPRETIERLPAPDERLVPYLPKISTLSLRLDLSEQIITKAKREGTTVHGALCAAALIAARRLRPAWAERKIEMISPICSRKALNLDDNFGLNITTHPVYFEGEQGLSFWDLARMAKAGLTGTDTADHVKDYLAFFRQLAFDTPNIGLMLGPLREAFNHQIMVTNIGRLKFETDFGTLKLQSLYGPMVRSGKGMEQTLGVNCTNGNLCLSNTSDNPIPGYLEEIQDVLTEACS